MAANKFIAPAVPITDRLHKEEEFFNKAFLMSYSGLNKLLFSPALFYSHYVLGQRDDGNDRNMAEGKLIHCLLLKPETFDDEFVLSAQDIPSENPLALLHRLFDHYKELKRTPELEDTREELHEFSSAILDILVDMKLYQSLKTDAQRLDKIITEKNVSYWEYLKSAEGRTVVDHDTYNFCKSVVDKIQSTPSVIDVMGFFEDPIKGIIKQNEIQLAMFPENYLFGLRGIIDNLVIDPSKKEIRINDLKKTSKDISSFTDSIEYYKYYLQAAMYKKLVEHVYKSKPAYADFTITFRFVVVDPYMQIAPIKVSNETMEKWTAILEQKLNEANYHFEKRSFELPYAFLVEEEVVI